MVGSETIFLWQIAIMFVFHVILATNGIFSADIDGPWSIYLISFYIVS